MALNLDPRQRAMLQEMGITLWMPKPAAPMSPPTPEVALRAAATVDVVPPPALVTAPVTAKPSLPQPSVDTTAPTPAPTTPVTASVTPVAAAAAPLEWQMAAAVQAFPTATGTDARDAWLVIWECPNPSAPFEGDTGKLLNNMLRALRLHHNPHVWIASMQRAGAEALPVTSPPTAPAEWQDLSSGLTANVHNTQPARILLLGMQPARAVLNSTEALGRLRAQVHQVLSTPTVVSYDPAYLLRSPHAKPAAWTDLCRAHHLRPPSKA